MKTAYLAISKSKRADLELEVQQIKATLKNNGIELFVFVDQYHFSSDQAKEMMRVAFDRIDQSDFIIAELSKKAIGVGVEVGYAFAKKKPIIYIRKKASAYSTTVAGSANFVLEYEEEKDLGQALQNIVQHHL